MLLRNLQRGWSEPALYVRCKRYSKISRAEVELAMTQRRNAVLNQEGFTLFATLLVAILLLSLGSGSLIATMIDLKGTTHFRTGTQALAAAESGGLHAVAAANKRMIMDFQAEITNQWSTLMGTGWYSVPGDPNLQYRAVMVPDHPWVQASPTRRGVVRVTGIGPLESRREILLYLQRAPFNFNWGAIYLAESSIGANVNGNSLDVTGDDMTLAGTPAGNGVSVPGVGLRVDEAEQDIRDAIAPGQEDNFQGFGPDPSVISNGGPTPADLMTLITAINALRGGSMFGDDNPVTDDGSINWVRPNNGGNISGNLQWGTVNFPTITLIDADRSNTINNTGAAEITVNGTVNGTGILLVDGNLTMSGDFSWTGWVISNGTLTIRGNPTVGGSVWAAGLNFEGSGSIVTDFCTQCLALAVQNLNLNQLPSKVEVLTWHENTWWESAPSS
jgi:hypothetical protein